jgi:excisionase family DNA binding protein
MEQTKPIPIRQAAKAVGISWQFARRLVDEGKVPAYRFGGKPDEPRLRVYEHELLSAVEAERKYEPPKAIPVRRAKRTNQMTQADRDRIDRLRRDMQRRGAKLRT